MKDFHKILVELRLNFLMMLMTDDDLVTASDFHEKKFQLY